MQEVVNSKGTAAEIAGVNGERRYIDSLGDAGCAL